MSKFALKTFNSKLVDILNEYELEPSELFYLLLVHTNQVDLLIRYCSYVKNEVDLEVPEMINGKKVFKPKKFRLCRENIDRILAKELVTDKGFDKEYNLQDIILSDKFRDQLDSIFSTSTKNPSYGEEFWDIYPISYYMEGKGKRIGLKSTDKDALIELYERTVDEDTHKKLMRGIKANKDSVNMKIDNFITSEFYKSFIDSNIVKTESNFSLG